MKLSDRQAARVATAIGRNIQNSGEELVHILKRYPTDDEARELYEQLKAALELVLIDFDFMEAEVVPNIDSIQLWADDNKGVGFRRPKGRVVYTVTGEVETFAFGWARYKVPLVKRSSDGRIQQMSIQELRKMVKEDA
jgi:hypothetical protein